MSEQMDKWWAFVQGYSVGIAALGLVSGMELTGWLLIAWLASAVSMLLLGHLVIEARGK